MLESEPIIIHILTQTFFQLPAIGMHFLLMWKFIIKEHALEKPKEIGTDWLLEHWWR